MALTVITPPSTEPVTLTEVKAQCRVDITDDDTLLTALITVAREMVEQITMHALVTRTYDLVLDEWPEGDTIVLPMPPLASVTSISYTTDAGVTSTFSSTNYKVGTAQRPGVIRLVDGASWPSDELAVVEGVKVRFVAGFGAAAAVPQRMKQALLLLAAHLYEHREAVTTDSRGGMQTLPLAVDALLDDYRATARTMW